MRTVRFLFLVLIARILLVTTHPKTTLTTSDLLSLVSQYESLINAKDFNGASKLLVDNPQLNRIYFNAEKYNEDAFKKLQLIRFLDDWAYQANVRGQINKPCDISEMMKSYEENLLEILNLEKQASINYIYPWDRKFEIEILQV